MKRLFDAAGVDYQQWRALVRAHLLVDYAAILGAYGDAAAGRAIRELVFTFIGFGFFGAAPAIVIWVADDPLVGATAMTTIIGALVAFMALHQSMTIVTPPDHDIIGFRPVSSRTYFAVRVTAVLWRSVEMAVTTGCLPCVAFLTRADGSFGIAAAAAAAVLLTAVAVTVFLVAAYNWLLGMLSPGRVPILAGYVVAIAGIIFGLGMVVAVMGAVDAFMPEGPSLGLARAHIPRSPVVLAVPTVWFASYVEIARGRIGGFELWAAALSAISLAGSALALRGRLSADYAARIAVMATRTDKPARSSPREWRQLQREARAVAIVAASHLRNDMALHTALAGNIIMAIVLFVIGPFAGFMDGGLSDPFLAAPLDGGGANLFLVYAVSMIPLSCRDALVTSGAAEASWLFFTTPADRVRLITAMRDVTTAFVLLPIMVIVAVVLVVTFGNVVHAVVHAAVLSVIAYNILQAVVLVSPSIPFSVAAERPRTSFVPSLARIPFMLSGVIVLVVFERLLYPSIPRALAGLAVLGAVAASLDVWTRRRLGSRVQALTYAG